MSVSSQPELMVLYTNDAVEVRYTDGGRLHLLPCGTTFTYSKPQKDAHPVNGMEMIQQRCRYVTSTYRDMVLSAMDFRNRFSEQPYLCEELLEADQVVHLYARINEIAWPKTLTTDNTEIMEDGGVCITSEDEFASLILSPHRRDFTVCYLTQLSQEKTRRKHDRNNGHTERHCDLRGECEGRGHSDARGQCEGKGHREGRGHGEGRGHNGARGHSEGRGQINGRETYKGKGQYDGQDQHEGKVSCTMPDVIQSHKGYQTPVNDATSPTRNKNESGKENHDDLNISPITQASCADSPQAMSNASGSPVTPQNTVKDPDAKFRPFSTPTEGLEGESAVCTPYGKTAVFVDYHGYKGKNNVPQTDNAEGSFLGEHFEPVRSKYSTDIAYPVHNKHSPEHDTNSKTKGRDAQQDNHYDYRYSDLRGAEDVTITSRESVRSISSRSSGEGESDTRCNYCWLTHHISCDECPVRWSQVVKMAQQVADKQLVPKKSNTVKQGRDRKQTDTSKLREINKKACIMSQVPKSLFLSCPGQHLHKMQSRKTYDDGKDPFEDPSTFAQGRLRVLLIDGVIYRIIRLATINVVEVYPGDGSVFVSQGMTAHFFLHIIPHKDKLEEKNYSIKSPPVSVKGSYSIKSLISRAHRFLAYIRQEDSNLPASVGLCCWKYEDSAVTVEPMSTTILEECEITGYGKFTALSNGQIRIVFKDRTCLDMTCDFSRRIQSCLEHSSDSQGAPRMLADKKAGTCRLLLPNGQYQMVDTDHPGMYKRYIDIAREWSEWVNCSPTQRQKFYKSKNDSNVHMSVERELQKIQCFNYVVDNTLLRKTNGNSANQSGAFKSVGACDQNSRPSILRNPDQQRNKRSGTDQEYRSVQIHSPPSATSIRESGIMPNSVTVQGHSIVQGHSTAQGHSMELTNLSSFSQGKVNSGHIGNRSVHPNRTTGVTMVESSYSNVKGFNSVREALLRTSSAIKDINSILDNR